MWRQFLVLSLSPRSLEAPSAPPPIEPREKLLVPRAGSWQERLLRMLWCMMHSLTLMNGPADDVVVVRWPRPRSRTSEAAACCCRRWCPPRSSSRPPPLCRPPPPTSLAPSVAAARRHTLAAATAYENDEGGSWRPRSVTGYTNKCRLRERAETQQRLLLIHGS